PRILPLFAANPLAGRWATVASDEQDVNDLLQNGNVDDKLRLAVTAGIEPLAAVQMGTVNPALYYRVDDRLGSIAPGRSADLVAVEDLEQFRVTDVVADGAVVVSDGKRATRRKAPQYPVAMRSVVRWQPALSAESFRVPARGPTARVRVIGVRDGSFVSERLEEVVPVEQGNARPVPEHDVLKLAVVNRHV